MNIKLLFAFLLVISLKIVVEGRADFPAQYLGSSSYYGFEDRVANRPSTLNVLHDASGGNTSGRPVETLRLPNTVQPVFYTLSMIPQLDGSFQFVGYVEIELYINESTKQILLHSYRLAINSVQVFQNSKQVQSNYTLSPVNQLMNITTKKTLYRRRTAILKIEFTGQLNDLGIGFYRSSYRGKNSTKWLAVTQFEPTYARWAFPCFDEPRFRVPFAVRLARYPHQTTLSNTPLWKTSSPDSSIGDMVWDTFETSPPMPSYLVAFVVGELKYRTDVEGKVKLWATERAVENAKYGQIQAASSLQNMEKLIGIPFALSKMDIVASPDFRFGGMENWGLILCKEKYTLLDDAIASELNKYLVTTVIAHEMAHQWFGDSVTISWWDYLWLKEGFATYFEYFLTDVMEPTWRIGELFNVEVVQFALNIDGIFSHVSMTSKVLSPEEILSKYDKISYEKAGAVIRMIEYIVSPATFKKALNLYIRTRKEEGGVAEPLHLYEAFDEEMRKEGKSLPHNLSVSTVFKTFSNQIGYPYVIITRQQQGARSNIIIKQRPYKSPRAVVKSVADNTTWIVPLSCTKQLEPDFSNTHPSIWLVDEKELFLSDEVESDEWFICNLQQTGYYRINYDLDSWKLIVKQLHSSHQKIHRLNRAQLIDDAYVFAIDEFLPFSTLFDLWRYLEHECDPLPWNAALNRMYDVVQQYESTAFSSELRNFVKKIIEHFYTYVGFHEKITDSQLIKILRPRLTFIACVLEFRDCVVKADAEFYKSNLSQIPSYVKETVLCSSMRANPAAWNKLWDYFRKSEVQYEQEIVLRSIGCARNETLLKKFLYKLVDDNDLELRKQQEILVIISVIRFREGVTATINFVRDVLPQIQNNTKVEGVVRRLLNSIRGLVQSHDQLLQLRHLLAETEEHLNKEKYGDIEESILAIEGDATKRIARNEKMAEKIHAALKTPPPPPPPPHPKSSAATRLVANRLAITFVLLLLVKCTAYTCRTTHLFSCCYYLP